jgi:Ser/Thr protein kinase RdoA (MazF antagonist)
MTVIHLKNLTYLAQVRRLVSYTYEITTPLMFLKKALKLHQRNHLYPSLEKAFFKGYKKYSEWTPEDEKLLPWMIRNLSNDMIQIENTFNFFD